jgi:hypothetical protein
MVELGDATTKFTVNQLQNSVDVLMDPGRALDRMRHSINNFSDAMYRSARPERDRHEMETDKDLTGRHHAESEQRNAQQHARDETPEHNGSSTHGSATTHQKHTGTEQEHTSHSRKQ